MKVKLRTDVTGSRNGVPWPPRGSVVELPDDEAIQLLEQGTAEPVTSDDVETAVDLTSVEYRTDAGTNEVPVPPATPVTGESQLRARAAAAGVDYDEDKSAADNEAVIEEAERAKATADRRAALTQSRVSAKAEQPKAAKSDNTRTKR